jgi:hypothetical protein
MKNSWRNFYRRLASIAVVSAGTTWSSAMCYAVQLAFDSAADVVYDNGWQAGDNGGFGFGPWNFDGTYNTAPPNQQAIDDGAMAGTTGSSPYNNIGRAWTIFNPNAPNFRSPGTPPGPDNPPSDDTDIARVGRAIPSNLQVGSTVKIVIDNPIEEAFYRGYTVQFNTGGGNTCYNCTPTARARIGTFEYFTYGRWYAPGQGPVALFDKDTDAGMRIEFTLTGADTFDLKMIPLDDPTKMVARTGSLGTGGPIDWIEIQFYNTDSDFYPTIVPPETGPVPGDYNNNGKVDAADYVLWRNGGPLMNEVADPGTVSPADYTAWRNRFGNSAEATARATDFYIRSMEITTASGSGAGLDGGGVPEPSTFVIVAAASAGVIALRRRREN